MKSASCRFFTVYGERGHETTRDRDDRALLRQAIAVRRLGNGEQIRNWTHVSDIVAGMIWPPRRSTTGRPSTWGRWNARA